MASDPTKPLLRLSVGEPQQRAKGKGVSGKKPEPFSAEHQRAVIGPKFDRLASVLANDQSGLELRSDPSALAPERLLVFEVRGSIQTFANAIQRVTGLELIDEEELKGDEQDDKPAVYLLVPDATALGQIVSLWRRWLDGEPAERGFAAWRDVFATLRNVRPWGPQDRVRDDERDIIAEEIDGKLDTDRIRLEIELVFRADEARGAQTEDNIQQQIIASDGRIVSRCRIADIGYHAVLADLPVVAVRSIIDRAQAGIAGLDFVMHIRPQSLATGIEVAEPESALPVAPVTVSGSPILALLDGVPVAQHPLLAGSLILDDQFGLEPLTQVADRNHGTAMASLIMHGDRNSTEQHLGRQLHCVPVLGPGDGFPEDRLIVDIIYQAVLGLRGGDNPTAPDVLMVNLSLGNARKPFQGQLSAWARLLDRLSYRFGILFLVSAGNHGTPFDVPNFDSWTDFESAASDQRAQSVVHALGQLITGRRLLAPAETVNGLTVGAANVDAVLSPDRLSARTNIDPFPAMTISNPSSALGPGFANSVKPDILMPGSREHIRFVSSRTPLSAIPSGPMRAHGLKVAAPPRGGIEPGLGYTNGTSAATALASRTCHQIHDALEVAYGKAFTSLSHIQRAVLLKALLVHSAAWPKDASDLIRQVLGPADNRKHVQQKDNIRRFLGYGLADPDLAIACVDDRATFWAVGVLPPKQKAGIKVPVPICISGKAQPHALNATLAWFTPVHPGRQTYKAVRLKLEDPSELQILSVGGAKEQPDQNQGRKGTVFSRRWEGNKAPAISTDQVIRFEVQREPDQGIPIDESIPFGLAITLTMPGVTQIYEEVRARLALAIAPRIEVF